MNLVANFSIKLSVSVQFRLLFIKMSAEYVTLSTLKEMLEL